MLLPKQPLPLFRPTKGEEKHSLSNHDDNVCGGSWMEGGSLQTVLRAGIEAGRCDEM